MQLATTFMKQKNLHVTVKKLLSQTHSNKNRKQKHYFVCRHRKILQSIEFWHNMSGAAEVLKYWGRGQLINQLIDYLSTQLVNYYCINQCLTTSDISWPSIFITRYSIPNLTDHVRRHRSIIIEPNADIRKHWNLLSQDSLPVSFLPGGYHVSYYCIIYRCLLGSVKFKSNRILQRVAAPSPIAPRVLNSYPYA